MSLGYFLKDVLDIELLGFVLYSGITIGNSNTIGYRIKCNESMAGNRRRAVVTLLSGLNDNRFQTIAPSP